jgi:hypothetical protein
MIWAACGGLSSMKMVAEYIEHAIRFEQMAAQEKDAKLRAEFEKQALAYRKLARERARKSGIPEPDISSK